MRSSTVATALAALMLLAVTGPAAMAKSKKAPVMKVKYLDLQLGEGNQPTEFTVKPGGTLATCTPNIYNSLYAFFEYKNMKKGYPTQAQWTLGGSVIYTNKINWKDKKKGTYVTYISNVEGVLADGLYQLTMKVKGKKVAKVSVTIESVTC